MREYTIKVPLRNKPSWHNDNTTPLKRVVWLWAPLGPDAPVKDALEGFNERVQRTPQLGERVGITDPSGERAEGEVSGITLERRRPDEVQLAVSIDRG